MADQNGVMINIKSFLFPPPQIKNGNQPCSIESQAASSGSEERRLMTAPDLDKKILISKKCKLALLAIYRLEYKDFMANTFVNESLGQNKLS